jgi:hypothetical protein
VSMQAETAGWRPMAFGATAPGRIEDPLFEPRWRGRRVLVEAVAGHVAIRAIDGSLLDGHEGLRAAVADAALADELLLDGWLVRPPLPAIEDAPALIDIGAVKTPAERLRHMFVGGRSQIGRAEALGQAGAMRAPKPAGAPGDEPVAFVATDLLWIDGQPLLEVPLQERKRLLDSALAEGDLVRRTVVGRAPLERWTVGWRALGFEEVILKGANGRYRPGRVSEDWVVVPIPGP